MYYTYLYIDPSRSHRLCPDGEPIYVGKGKNDRAYAHLKRTDSTHFSRRLAKMQRAGVLPVIKMLATDIDEELAFLVEQEAIAKYGRRDLGLGPLLNLTDGGEGVSGHIWTDEQRQRVGDGVRRAFQDDQRRQRRTRAVMVAKAKPEVRARTSASMKDAHAREFEKYSRSIKTALARPESKERQRRAAKSRATPELNAKRAETLHITLSNRSAEDAAQHAINISKAKLRPCTVDGITIYASVRDLVKDLGQGINGRKSPNFRYVTDTKEN